MVASLRAPTTALTACVLLLIPGNSIGQGVLVQRGQASAAQEFRIVVPRVLRVLENSHPVRLDAEADGGWSAEQRLVVFTNMKRGFCITLRMSAPEVGAWRLHTPQSGGITLDAVHDGYRLCTPRPGRYTLLLKHEFDATTQRSTTGVLTWPVQTNITSL